MGLEWRRRQKIEADTKCDTKEATAKCDGCKTVAVNNTEGEAKQGSDEEVKTRATCEREAMMEKGTKSGRPKREHIRYRNWSTKWITRCDAKTESANETQIGKQNRNQNLIRQPKSSGNLTTYWQPGWKRKRIANVSDVEKERKGLQVRRTASGVATDSDFEPKPKNGRRRPEYKTDPTWDGKQWEGGTQRSGETTKNEPDNSRESSTLRTGENNSDPADLFRARLQGPVRWSWRPAESRTGLRGRPGSPAALAGGTSASTSPFSAKHHTKGG